MKLTLGTRGSQLALAQAHWVQAALRASGGVTVDIRVVTTKSDRDLLEGRVDLAVHSLKDLPTDMPEGVSLASVPEREDPRDVLILPEGMTHTLQTLPRGAKIGTSSTRRRAWVGAFRPDLTVGDIRGDVDTRLRKLDGGEVDALVLAAAGIRRLGLMGRANEWLEAAAWMPAPGQGALGIVIREGDVETMARVAALTHDGSARAVRAERSLLAALGGGCGLPVGALGLPYGEGLRLRAMVASSDGRRVVRADLTGSAYDPEGLGHEMAELLKARGADDLLASVVHEQSPASA